MFAPVPDRLTPASSRDSWGPRLGAVLAALVLLAIAAPSALGAPAWTPAVSLGAGYNPDVALDRDGKAIVVYGAPPDCFFCGGDIEARVRPPGDTWHAPEYVGETGYRGLGDIELALDDHGDAVAIWEPGDSGTGGGYLFSGVRPAGGPWGAPVELSGGSYVSQYDLALDPDGKAIAVWTLDPFTLDGERVFAAVRPVGSGWQAGQELTNPSYTAWPRVALDAAGRGAAIWQEGDQSDAMNVVASLRPVGGPWSQPTPLTKSAVQTPDLGVDAAGNLTVVWIRESLVQVVERAVSTGVWTSPRSLSTFGDAESLTLAVGPDGSAIAGWIRSGYAYAASRPPGGTWEGAHKVSIDKALSLTAAVSPKGTLVLAWSTSTGQLQVATRPASGPWMAPIGFGAGYRPKLATDAAGNVILVWSTDAGAIQTSTYDSTAPGFSRIAVPATAVSGASVSVSMDVADLWSPVTETGWDFGDGATASGTSASHAYAAPGTYTVTARAVDALGNASAQTRQITVVAPPPPPLPVPTITFTPTGPSGTVSITPGLVVAIPGASSGSTPAPQTRGTRPLAGVKALLHVRVVVPAMRAGAKGVLSVRLDRAVRGALVRVQLRKGLRYRTIAEGRVSGRRVPVALAFASPGRYLLRIQVIETGRRTVNTVAAVVVRAR